MSEDVAVIAAGLTPTQRKAVLFIGDGPYDHGISLFATFWHRPENTGLLQVIRHNLGLTSSNIAEIGCGPVERLTPLGLAVRAYLQGNPS